MHLLQCLTCLYLELWLAYSLTVAGRFAAAARDPDTGPRPVLGAKEHSARLPYCSCCFFCAPAAEGTALSVTNRQSPKHIS